MSGILVIDILIIAIGGLGLIHIGCIGVDADLPRWTGTRESFLLCASSYLLMFAAILSLLLSLVPDTPLPPWLPKFISVVAMVWWLYARPSPFRDK